MRLPIKNYITTMTGVMSNTLIASNVNPLISNAFVIAYSNVFSEYGEKGEYYIYDGDTEEDAILVMSNVHIGITRKLIFELSQIEQSGLYKDLADAKDTYTMSGNSDTAGMAETSPINAETDFETGGIVTPNAKSINKNEYETTHIRNNYDIRRNRFYDVIIRNFNLYGLIEKNFIQLVYEHNIIY